MRNSLLRGSWKRHVANKDGSDINPFRQKHYMLLNLAIGGLNGGDPDNTNFPNRFEVDYVRVFQKGVTSAC